MQPDSTAPGLRGTVAFVTYTMSNPHVVGVFFRALRLAIRLHRRGWSIVVCNVGPVPEDPKVDRFHEFGEILRFGGRDGATNMRAMIEILQRIRPDLVVFGEAPFPGMEPFFDGARTVGAPLVVLDQLYGGEIKAESWGIDRLILYGLATLIEDAGEGRNDVDVMPPFIHDVTPVEDLPVPRELRSHPWVTILGFDRMVLEGGLRVLSALRRNAPVAIALSHDPERAELEMKKAGISPDRRVSLPLFEDADMFGLIAASHGSIVANGFMQVMESLALGTPSVSIDRGRGMPGWAYDERFHPFIATEGGIEELAKKLDDWLEQSPFSEQQLERLALERGGVDACVERLEAIARSPRFLPRVQRLSTRLRWILAHSWRAQDPELLKAAGIAHARPLSVDGKSSEHDSVAR